MSKYYVRKEKMKRLEREFKADIRKIQKLGIKFDMGCPARLYDGKFTNRDMYGDVCGTCLVGARVICPKLKSDLSNDFTIGSDLAVAAKDLRVKIDWLEDLYRGFSQEDVDAADYPQAAKLSLRLQKYAEEIGA